MSRSLLAFNHMLIKKLLLYECLFKVTSNVFWVTEEKGLFSFINHEYCLRTKYKVRITVKIMSVHEIKYCCQKGCKRNFVRVITPWTLIHWFKPTSNPHASAFSCKPIYQLGNGKLKPPTYEKSNFVSVKENIVWGFHKLKLSEFGKKIGRHYFFCNVHGDTYFIVDNTYHCSYFIE